MNHLSHAIRRFDRFEIKYLITLEQAERFRSDLSAYLTPDEHGDVDGAYRVASLYYDSPDLRFYWEKIDGIRFRRKLRIRHYESRAPFTADTPVFVEVKQRLNRVTQKRRACLPYSAALCLCSERRIPEYDPQDTLLVDEVAGMTWQDNLRPSSLVRFTRAALVGGDYDLGLRVTFDTSLSYQPVSETTLAGDPLLLGLDGGFIGLPLLPADQAIIEIKVNERIPYWLTELVAMHNLNLIRISKYCRSIELARQLADPAWRLSLA
jgi:hypothetical protein